MTRKFDQLSAHHQPGLETLEPRMLLSGTISAEFVSVDNSAALTGYNTFDLQVTTSNDWTAGVLLLNLTQGTIYQDAAGSVNAPNPAAFGFIPTLEFDTSLGGDTASSSIAGAAGDIGGDAYQFDTVELDATWFNTGTTDTGTFSVARITLSDDAVGTWSYKVINASTDSASDTGTITAGALTPPVAPPPPPPPPSTFTAEFVAVDNTAALTGYKTHDLQVTTPTDWTRGSLVIELYQGRIYQDPSGEKHGAFGRPSPSLYGADPTFEFDTYLSIDHADSNPTFTYTAATELGSSARQFGEYEISATWNSLLTTTDTGTFEIARITLSDDAVGRWSMKLTNVDGDVVEQSGAIAAGDLTGAAPPPAPQQVDGDVNGDGKTDILWRNRATGQTSFWQMDGTTFHSSNDLPDLDTDTDWRAVGTGDFNGDGRPDILLRNMVDGSNKITSAINGQVNWQTTILSFTSQNWQVAGVGDMTGDNQADILWRNTKNGRNLVWQMDGASVQDRVAVKRLRNTDWQSGGLGDFNGDGKLDILWRNTVNGRNTVWSMNGTRFQGGTAIKPVKKTEWVIGSTGDYNNDGKTDILWRNTLTGQNTVWQMNGTAFVGGIAIQSQPDQDWQIASPLLGLWEA